jgi:peptidoglycan/LPS O-acetylase OafA/YrhL
MTHQSTTPKQRLVGIDLFRGVSAYAVILIHAGTLMLYLGLPTNYWTTALRAVSSFAVPFFLASSFYLMTSKLYTNNEKSSISSNIKSRSVRLLLPYFYWSLIYLGLRLVKALATSEDLSKLFQDPVLLIFLGGASIHLYFLPLLFTGSFLIIVAEFLAKRRISLLALVFLLVLSTIIYEWQIVSGNNFEFSTKFGINCLELASSCSVAFQSFTKLIFPNGNNSQLIRLLLVELSWLTKCLPYILMAMLLNHPYIKKRLDKFDIKHALMFLITAILISIFWLLKTFEFLYFPESLYELSIAFSMLLSGICLSVNLKENYYLKNLGICSFGIYLMHYLVLTIYGVFVSKLPIEIVASSPILTMLMLTTLSFFTSWTLTSVCVRKKLLSKVLFGT